MELMELFNNFLLNLTNRHFFIKQSFYQEGLLLAYHSSCSMLINKTIEKVFMAEGFAFTEAWHLGQDCWDLLSNLIGLLRLPFEKIGIQSLRQSRFGVNGLFFQNPECLWICLLT
jgi:hypothetical protein